MALLLYVFIIAVRLFGVVLGSCDLTAGLPPYYVVHKVNDSEMSVDGIGAEKVWQDAPHVSDFRSIYGERFEEDYPEEAPWYHTRARMLWSDKYLYVLAELEEKQVWATDFGWDLPPQPLNRSNPRPDCTSPDSHKHFPTCPFRNGDFEFFIAPGKHGSPEYYKEFEFNANVDPTWNHNKGPAIMTLSFPRPYHDLHGEVELWLNNRTNRALGGMKYSVRANTSINDPSQQDQMHSWSVEVRVPLKYLMENVSHVERPGEGVWWRTAFSRVEYHLRESASEKGFYEPYLKYPIERKQAHLDRNFVWPPTYMYDIHMPDQWGAILFTERSVPLVKHNPLSNIWGAYGTLSRLYYAQWAHQVDHERFAFSVSELRQTYEQLSDKTAKTPFKDLKQVYAFPIINKLAWTPACVKIAVIPDAQTGWKAFVVENGDTETWIIDGWRRISKVRTVDAGDFYK